MIHKFEIFVASVQSVGYFFFQYIRVQKTVYCLIQFSYLQNILTIL